MAKNDFPFMNMDFGKMFNVDVSKMMKDFKMPGVNMDQMMATHRKNMEAFTAANQLAAEGFQAVAKRQTEIMKEGLEEFAVAMKDMMAQGSPEANASKHADYTKHAVERALSNVRELSEMVAKSNTEALDVLNKRLMEGLDEMKAMAPKGMSPKAH